MSVHYFNEHVLVYTDHRERLSLAVRKTKEVEKQHGRSFGFMFWKPEKPSIQPYPSDESVDPYPSKQNAKAENSTIKVGGRDYVPIVNVKVVGPYESVKAFLIFESHNMLGCLDLLLRNRLISVE